MTPAVTLTSVEDEILYERLLVEAAARGDIITVTKLLQLGVNVDADNYNKTLLNASKNYITPLQMACDYNHPCCAALLITNRANRNAKDCFDVTAMHMAAAKGHLSCLQVLLDANAECSIPTKLSKTVTYISAPYPGGTTPLHIATRNSHVDCIEKLMMCGADYNAVDEFGRTSLYIAAQNCNSSCVLALLRNAVGTDILALPSRTGDTPLHFVVRECMLECIEELLKSGSCVNHLNREGYSPLHYAVFPSLHIDDWLKYQVFIFNLSRKGPKVKNFLLDLPTKEILEMLVLKGYNTDINLCDNDGFSPLHYVSYTNDKSFRRSELMKFLISYGADVHIYIRHNFTCSYEGIHGRTFRMSDLTLLEFELFSPLKDFEVLKYIVRSLLHPPRFIKLRVIPFLPSRTPQAVLPSGYVMSENELVAWKAMSLCHYSDMIQPTFLSLDTKSLYYEDDNSEVEDWNSFHKHIWYETMTSNPRTLQHYCRYAIRKALGPSSKKNIKNLPVPKPVQSYLLLEYGD